MIKKIIALSFVFPLMVSAKMIEIPETITYNQWVPVKSFSSETLIYFDFEVPDKAHAAVCRPADTGVYKLRTVEYRGAVDHKFVVSYRPDGSTARWITLTSKSDKLEYQGNWYFTDGEGEHLAPPWDPDQPENHQLFCDPFKDICYVDDGIYSLSSAKRISEFGYTRQE